MTPAERRRLVASALAEFATDLEWRGYPHAGGLRQLGRIIATLDTAEHGRCQHCGQPIDGMAHARRVFCSDSCRKRASRRRKRDGIAS